MAFVYLENFYLFIIEFVKFNYPPLNLLEKSNVEPPFLSIILT